MNVVGPLNPELPHGGHDDDLPSVGAHRGDIEVTVCADELLVAPSPDGVGAAELAAPVVHETAWSE